MANSTNITPEVKAAFNAMTSGEYDNFALFSCFVNGQPASAICSINKEGEEYIISPLFVTVTDDMVLTDHEGIKSAA